jgi:N-formylglutamate amidohydrolase
MPVPGDETLFYIFTTKEVHGTFTYELRYSLFDLKLNNGQITVEGQTFRLDPPFHVLTPIEQSVPFVFCSPHSGSTYPAAFIAASKLDPLSLRKSEDVLVDQLFAGVASLGAPLLAARFPRAYLDVNREPYELDPQLFDEPLPRFANSQSMRVAGGLGTIARVVADAEEIYSTAGRPSLEAALQRIELVYKPFHQALAQLITATRDRFGIAIVIDCHSMPSTSMSRPGPGSRPDIVLGDRFGASCDGRVTRVVRDTIADLGLQVLLNRPYAGGFITEYYGNPARGVQSLQLEINRGLYLDEATLSKSKDFQKLARALRDMAMKVFAALPLLLEGRAAAE